MRHNYPRDTGRCATTTHEVQEGAALAQEKADKKDARRCRWECYQRKKRNNQNAPENTTQGQSNAQQPTGNSSTPQQNTTNSFNNQSATNNLPMKSNPTQHQNHRYKTRYSIAGIRPDYSEQTYNPPVP